jgi:8-oxo-dGTP diphosphatase
MIDVACAIIVDPGGRILVTQRSAVMKLPLKIEFPGGKVEKEETPMTCLIREIKEELNLDIRIVFEMPVIEHTYPDISIRLIPFVCEIAGGTIILREHAAYDWFDANELSGLDWAEADIPVMKNYLNSIRG